MTDLTPISLNDPKVPKYFRKMSKLILKLWSERNIEKLRSIRDSKTNIKLRIYHHSEGTDSYFCDKRSRYFTWSEVDQEVNDETMKGEYTMTLVMPYKSNVMFTRGSANQAKYN